MADEREVRIGENEILFRVVNEEIHSLGEQFGAAASPTESFVCECGAEECVERIELTPAEYHEVRADPATFAVVPGHERPEVEYVISANERFALIRKREGVPAKIASEHDPRSQG